MTGKRRELSDSTPLLGYPQPLQHYTPFSSSLLEMAATTTTVDSAPLRSVFLGVDVGTGSARAGPLSLSLSLSLPIYTHAETRTHACISICVDWILCIGEMGHLFLTRLMCLYFMLSVYYWIGTGFIVFFFFFPYWVLNSNPSLIVFVHLCNFANHKHTNALCIFLKNANSSRYTLLRWCELLGNFWFLKYRSVWWEREASRFF